MRTLVHRLRPDLSIALVLLALPLVHFAPVVLGTRTLLPADNLLAIEPWRSAAGQFSAVSPPVPHNRLLDDLVLENYPWKKFILESLRAGELPLWNPYQFAGVPFLAAGQHSALYPFSLIFYIAPLARAYGLFAWSQFFLAGLLAYGYLRVLGVQRLGALVAAIVYQLSLFMVVSVVFPMIIAAAVWLPLVLTAIELAVRQQPALGARPATLPWIVMGAGALGLQILAGHVEITYYTLLVAGAYAAWRLIAEYSRWRADGSKTRAAGAGPHLRRLAGRAAALLALAGAGVGLGAIQFIPLYELVRHNFRSGSATFDQIIGWSYPWRHVLHFLVPNFLGNSSHHGYFDLFSLQWRAATVNALGERIDTIQWGIKNSVEGGAYLGLLPLLLVPLSLAYWLSLRRQVSGAAASPQHAAPLTLIPFFTLLAAVCLAFAFPTRLYAVIYWLPGIDQLHSPFRWVWVLSLCVAVLSAFGIEYLCQFAATAALSPTRSRRRAAGTASLAARLARPLFVFASPSLVSALAGLAVWGGSLVIIGLLAAWRGYDTLGVDRLMDFLLADWVRANQAFADGRMFFSYEARWLFQMALLLIASGLVLRLAASPAALRRRSLWKPLAVSVLALDLIVAGWGFNPAADPAILAYTPPSVEFLRQDDGLWRFTSYDPQGDKPYNANTGWYFNFYDVRGYDSIFTQQYMRYMQLIQNQYELDFNRIAPINEPAALNSPLLDLLNVKYVVTTAVIDNPKYTLVYDAEVRVYRNETALPRAYTQPLAATLVTSDFGATVQGTDPRQHVLVAALPAGVANSPLVPSWPGPVQDIAYSPNEVLVTAEVEQPAWIVLADSYFPGWKAYLRAAGATEDDERPLDIALVNGNFRGVVVPAGAWTVRFKYSPDSVKLGAIISFITGMTLVFGLAVFTWRYFYRESALDSTARRVAKNALAPMALNLVNRAVDLGFAAFMLRVLGPADAGKYYFAIVIFGWFEIITNYGLNTLLTRDVARDPAHANRYLVNTTLLRLALGLVVIPGLVGLLWLRQVLPSFELPLGLGAFHPDRLTPDTLWAIALLVLAQAPATVAIGLSALFYAFEKAEYPAAVSTLTTLAKVSLGTVALVLGYGFVGLAGVSLITNVLTLGLLGGLAWRLFFPRGVRWEFDARFQGQALRESFPLMLNNLLATLFFKVDVTLLEPIRGAREVGWYSTAYKFVDAYNLVPSLFTFALFPVMSRQAREDRPALRRSYLLAVKLLSALALPLAIVTTALAPLMVGLLGGRAYLPFGAAALAILIWSIPFGWVNSVTNYLLIALDQQRGLSRAFAAALIFNVAVNLVFLPRYGFAAAAAITIVSEFFEGLAFYWYLRRSLGPVPWVRLLWRLWLSAIIMAGAVYALWSVQPFLALLAGAGLYAGSLLLLRAFSPDEQAVLLGILPARLRPGPPPLTERT